LNRIAINPVPCSFPKDNDNENAHILLIDLLHACLFATSGARLKKCVHKMFEVQEPSVQEFYSYMQEAIDDEDWWSAIDFGEIVLYHFPESPFSQEVPFLIGMAYYHLNQYELANTALSEYLKNSTSPKHF
jgi:outer membrane protein assembly factor BamD (BamD/ComL family)